jgi:hypothetical protein
MVCMFNKSCLFFLSILIYSLQNPRKRAVSESAGKFPKKIKLEDSEFSKTIDSMHCKKSKSEPPSLQKVTTAALLNSKEGESTSTITPLYKSVMRNNRRRITTISPSSSARSSINTLSNMSTSSRPTRTNSVGKSIQDFFAARGASAPVFSSTSQQGSTPTVKYFGPPSQLVRSVNQRQEPAVSPSATGSGTSSRNRTSSKTTGDQSGARSVRMNCTKGIRDLICSILFPVS